MPAIENYLQVDPEIETGNKKRPQKQVTFEDEIERLTMAYSPKLQKILALARQQIKEQGGISHEDFWKDIDNGQKSTGSA